MRQKFTGDVFFLGEREGLACRVMKMGQCLGMRHWPILYWRKLLFYFLMMKSTKMPGVFTFSGAMLPVGTIS